MPDDLTEKEEKPWLLFDLAKDPWQMKTLVDDPASQSLVQQMDDRLAAIMRQTGDSWDIKADQESQAPIFFKDGHLLPVASFRD